MTNQDSVIIEGELHKPCGQCGASLTFQGTTCRGCLAELEEMPTLEDCFGGDPWGDAA